jgi:hypothetical protein
MGKFRKWNPCRTFVSIEFFCLASNNITISMLTNILVPHGVLSDWREKHNLIWKCKFFDAYFIWLLICYCGWLDFPETKFVKDVSCYPQWVLYLYSAFKSALALVNLTAKFLNLGASHSRGISLNLVTNPFNQYNYKKESKQTFYFFFLW